MGFPFEIRVCQDKQGGVEYLAERMFTGIQREATKPNPQPVIFPTGSTYEGDRGVYATFARRAREAGLYPTDFPFRNMDIYLVREGKSLVPLEPTNSIGYQCFMQKELWTPWGIQPTDHRFPLPRAGVYHRAGVTCPDYTMDLARRGGVFLAFGGIGGADPHVAFNGVGSPLTAPARVVRLSRAERQQNADIYRLAIKDIPEYAATVGMKELHESDELILAAFGEGKARVIQMCIEGEVSAACPAGFMLHSHKKAVLVIDEAAASQLSEATRARCIAA